MKLTCPHSGIQYTINSGYGTASQIHPATDVPLKRLTTQLADYHTGKLSDTDQYLYLLAWFKQLPSVQFRLPANESADFPILTLLSEPLIKTVIGATKFPHLDFPTFVVSEASTISSCLSYWLSTIQSLLAEQKLKASQQRNNAELLRLESALDRITTYHLRSNVTRAAKLVASWSARAGAFSLETITSPTGDLVTLSAYWQHIITLAFNESHTSLLAARIPPADVSELIEHCEDNIPHGTVYAHELMKRLRIAQKVLDELSGKPKSVQRNLILGTTDLIEPERKKFKSGVEYLKARVKWQAAMLQARAGKAMGVETEETEQQHTGTLD